MLMPEISPGGEGGGGGWAQLELTDAVTAATDYCFPAVDKY